VWLDKQPSAPCKIDTGRKEERAGGCIHNGQGQVYTCPVYDPTCTLQCSTYLVTYLSPTSLYPCWNEIYIDWEQLTRQFHYFQIRTVKKFWDELMAYFTFTTYWVFHDTENTTTNNFWMWCDITPESSNTGSEKTAVAMQLISIHVPAVTSTHAKKVLRGGQQGDLINLN
jgi:hypothetical protein